MLATNRAINVIKEKAAAGNVIARQADVVRLQATKARQDPALAQLCDAYAAEKAAKSTTGLQRDQAREALEQYRRNVFPNYQNAMNQYLGRFNAGFRLEQIQPTNTRGGSACSYSLRINNVVVPVTADVAPGQHAFSNTLSSGDRNTLALAFFFAWLDQNPNLAGKIIVMTIRYLASMPTDHRRPYRRFAGCCPASPRSSSFRTANRFYARPGIARTRHSVPPFKCAATAQLARPSTNGMWMLT